MTTDEKADFPRLLNDDLLRAARGEPVSRVPIWVHRQAGRYLPEYLETRSQVKGFFDLCRTPELACKVTLDPIIRFDLDAAIIFSDILVVPQAMGMEVKMKESTGPHFPAPLLEPSHLDRLQVTPVEESLKYVYDAIRLTRHALQGRVPLIGFTGAPWTLMAYMIHGGGAKTFDKAKAWLYKWPEASRRLLQAIADVIIAHLVNQVKAGAQMLEVFDSWAGDLTTEAFLEWELPVLTHIQQEVRRQLQEAGITPVPMTIFPKGVSEESLTQLANSGYDCISVDWTIRCLCMFEYGCIFVCICICSARAPPDARLDLM
jgi:uroporphyrinogen decarboxylase